MSGSHKEFPKKAVVVQLGLAALVGIGFIFAEKPDLSALTEKVTKPIVAAAAKVLAPIGKVEVKEQSIASAARSGAEVYASTCGVCHDNGVAGAPKLDDKGTWETRLSDGFSALVASAINGKGGMPARGGNPDITDSEMELTVSHMIKEAGIELVAKSASAASTTEAKPEMATKAEIAPEVKKITEAEVTPAVEKTTKVEVKPEVVEKIKEVAVNAEEAIVKSKEAVEVTTTETINEKLDTVVEKAEEVVTQTKEVAKEEVTAKTETVTEKVEEVKAETTTTTASSAVVVAAVVDHSAGEAVYKSSCFACHDSGVAGSPKLGDKAAWSARIAAGAESMHQAAINGKGAMPAKGGNTSLSDTDVKAAADYMAAQSM